MVPNIIEEIERSLKNRPSGQLGLTYPEAV